MLSRIFAMVPSDVSSSSAPSGWFLVGLLVLFPVFFVGVWVSAGLMLGQMSGWTSLAKAYGTHPPYDGPKVLTSGRVGMVGYNGVLQVAADEAHLHLSVLVIFRKGHPPLSIPWSDIEVSNKKSFFIDYVRFRVDGTHFDIRRREVLELGVGGRLPTALAPFLEKGETQNRWG